MKVLGQEYIGLTWTKHEPRQTHYVVTIFQAEVYVIFACARELLLANIQQSDIQVAIKAIRQTINKPQN